MKRLVLLMVLGLAACGQDAPAESAATAEGPARYTTRGTIENLTPMRAEIAHEDVPGYMPAMTMPFFAKEEGQLTPFTVGDSVEFTFEVQEGGRHEIVSISKR
ncbi:MAG: copper-binding protein [Polyangiales bacterium]|nr:copper-binding protein [Myxococcales bacterium]